MTHSTPTHPVEPEPYPPGEGSDTPSPNPTQLPIEPDLNRWMALWGAPGL